jgi:hypothetical protein
MYMVFLLYTMLIIVNILTSIPYVLGQANQTKQELDINKIRTEIKLLEGQIKLSESQINPLAYPWVLLTYSVPIGIALAAALVPAYYGWRRERNKIPTIDKKK